MYQITAYSRRRAREMGVEIERSANPAKKLDVYKDGKKIASIGAIGYSDYPTYMREKGKKYADERRRLYLARHKKKYDRLSPSELAKYILW